MRGHVDIVQGNGDQPWHVRLTAASDEPLSASEQLARKHAADENVLAQARVFGFDEPRLVHVGSTIDGPDDEGLLHSGPTICGHSLEREIVIAQIRYVDEREEPAP